MKIYGDKIYEHHFSTRGWGKYPSEEVIRFFMFARENLGYSKLKALDIGCGIGACSWFMAKEGSTITAMDGAPSGINNVNKLVREFGIDAKIEIIHGDITKRAHSHVGGGNPCVVVLKDEHRTSNIERPTSNKKTNTQYRTFNSYL